MAESKFLTVVLGRVRYQVLLQSTASQEIVNQAKIRYPIVRQANKRYNIKVNVE